MLVWPTSRLLFHALRPEGVVCHTKVNMKSATLPLPLSFKQFSGIVITREVMTLGSLNDFLLSINKATFLLLSGHILSTCYYKIRKYNILQTAFFPQNIYSFRTIVKWVFTCRQWKKPFLIKNSYLQDGKVSVSAFTAVHTSSLECSRHTGFLHHEHK